MRRSLFDHPEARRMRAPFGWRALAWEDQTALKRRCFVILDGLPAHGDEHYKDELDRRLAEVLDIVREAQFTTGSSPEGLVSLVRTQLEAGNFTIIPRLFAWAIPDWRLRKTTIPILSGALGAAVVFSLLTSPGALLLAVFFLAVIAGVVVVYGALVRWRNPHLSVASTLMRQLDTLLETGPAEAAAAKYEELRAALRPFAHEPFVRVMTIKAGRHVAESGMFSKDKEILRKVVDDATATARAVHATVVQLHEAAEALRAAGPALVPIDRDTAYAVAGILDELAAGPGFHGWGCRATAREIRRDLGEPWVV